MRADEVIQWAVVLHHPDRSELLYVVPADYFPMLDSVDVGVDESRRSARSPCVAGSVSGHTSSRSPAQP